MKQIKTLSLIALASLFLLFTPAYATTNFSTDKTSIEPGEEFTISLKIDEVAAWNISIKATGAVEDCSLREVDVTEDALNTVKTFTKTCQAKSVGDIIISLKGDYTPETGETEELSAALKVVVAEKEAAETDEPGEADATDEADKSTEDDKANESTPGTGSFTKENETLVASSVFYLIGFIGILIGGIYLAKRHLRR